MLPPVHNRAAQHEGTGHLAINNTFLRRVSTLVALQATARFYRYDGPCVPISNKLMVKTGPFVHLAEAATIKFVASKTSIPVPRVYKNQAFILMERIQGLPLAKAWKTLSEADRENVLAQLRDMIKELRALPPLPGTGVESCEGGSVREPRIPRKQPRFGPFKAIQEFHSFPPEHLRPEDHPDRPDDQDWKDIKDDGCQAGRTMATARLCTRRPQPFQHLG